MWTAVYTTICHVIECLIGVIVIFGIAVFLAMMIFVIYFYSSELASYIKEVRSGQADRQQKHDP